MHMVSNWTINDISYRDRMNADTSLRLYANTFISLLQERVEDRLEIVACYPSDISSGDAGPSLISGTMSDLFCDPCLEDGNNNQAEGYCVDCTHHLCEICFLHHRRPKPSRHHQLLDKQLMPKSKSDKVYKDECTEKCATHGEKTLRYFCEDHKLVGCTVCVTLGHRACNVGYIPTLSRDFCDSREYRAFKRDIEYFARRFRSLQEAATCNLEYIDKHAERAKDKIRKLRKEIDIFFDDLEQEISDKVNTVQIEDQDTIEAISKKCEALSETIKRLQADIEDKERTNQRCCLFVDVRELHDILEKYKNDISTMEKTNIIRDLTFRPSETISKLISDQSVEFGSLVDFCQTVSASSHLDNDTSSIAVLAGGRVAVIDTGSDCMKFIDTTHDSCCSTPTTEDPSKEPNDDTSGNERVTIEEQSISNVSDQYTYMQKENEDIQCDSEANETELEDERHASFGEVRNIVVQLKSEEETITTPTSHTLVTIEELPVSISREQYYQLQRQNDILQQRVKELELTENGLKEQLQNVIIKMKETKLRNVDNTSARHSLVAKEDPHESMRTEKFASLQRENDGLWRRLIELEANEKGLHELLQQACNERDEARKSNVDNTSARHSLVAKEDPHESMRTEEFASLQRENDGLWRRLIELEANEKGLHELLQQACNEMDEARKSNVNQTTVRHSLAAIEDSHESMRTEQFASLQRENDALWRQLSNLEASEKELRKLLQQAYNEGDEARKRLREIMSNILTDNNSNISDLGDKLRPTKLTKLMSELYDNQWTDAFDYFEDTRQGEFSERACINFLLHVLMEVYTYCSRKVSAEWKSMINSLSLSMEKDQVLLKQLKDNRKANALKKLPRILESCLETLKHIPLSNDPGFDITLEARAVKEYLQECVRLCWLLVVQDPPVYLYCNGWESSQSVTLLDHTRKQGRTTYDGKKNGNARHDRHQGLKDDPDDINGPAVKPGTRGDGDSVPGRRNRVLFNKDHYREYTKRGAYLKFVVWPIMFFFEGGPVLQKGVAEGGD